MSKVASFIKTFGGQKLAAELGVSKATVSSWKNGRALVTPKHCRKLALLSDNLLTVHDIRPDIFGEEDGIDRRRTDRRIADRSEPTPASPDEGQAA